MLVVLVWIIFWGLLFALLYWRPVLNAWREPVLRCPVLIFESDDWGPDIDGRQASVLLEMKKVLENFQDDRGRHPVMTLGMVLAIPDSQRMLEDGLQTYHRRLLSEASSAPLLNIIQQGIAKGVFSVQLHGMEHFWPDSLMSALQDSPELKKWILSDALSTEDLPSPLQSRWTNASSLPSIPHSDAQIKQAVSEEVAKFSSIFGSMPTVVVPPTFVWDERVEKAWAEENINVLVTPGRCYIARDAEGGLVVDANSQTSNAYYNGMKTLTKMMSIVRDNYFEPILGHTADQSLTAIEEKKCLGRPALLEMHRFNFMGGGAERAASLDEIRRLLEKVMKSCPNVAFLSTEQLAAALKRADPDLLEPLLKRKIHIILLRFKRIIGLRKMLCLSGFIIPYLALLIFFKPASHKSDLESNS